MAKSKAVRACVASLTAGAVLFCLTADSAPPKLRGVKLGTRALLKLEQEYIAPLGTDESPLSKGMKADLYLQTGKKLEQVEITELLPGKQKNTLKILGITLPKGGKQKIPATNLAHLATEDKVFDVVQDPSAKSFFLLDLARRDELAQARLSRTGHALWDDPSDEERAESIEKSKELFKEARKLFPGHNFLMQETEFYLFFTDLPAEQIAGYLNNLDTMYRQLCLAFGILPDKNIWKGKCPVLAFANAEMYHHFEATVMKNPKSEGTQGLHHGSYDGSVVIVIWIGKDPAYFAATLVHETAHGFVHRMRSNVHIVPWLNEGIAEWIAGVAVPGTPAVARRQSDGIAFLRMNRTMGGFFQKVDGLTPTDYGIASSLTEFMLQTDANLYRAFLTAIKDGYPLDEALKLTYDCTPEVLVESFGNSIGVPDLQP
ncbi:hypothetical protein [Schlesneria sp.]|uniref:hypothetical protein n=1 Tax=Schlesneria sp. TaxID=2762018 RepID=UPI002EE0516F